MRQGRARSAAERGGLFGNGKTVRRAVLGVSKFSLILLSKNDPKLEPFGSSFWNTFSLFRALSRVSKFLCFSQRFSIHLPRAKVGVSLRTSFKNQANATLQKGSPNGGPGGSIWEPKIKKKRFLQRSKITSFLRSILGAFWDPFWNPNFIISV